MARRDVRRSELAELLSERREEVIRRWTEGVRPPLGLEAMPRAELLQSIPDLLDDITYFLTQPREVPPGESTEQISGAHGRHRFAIGFDLKEVIREFDVLLDVIADMIHDYQPRVELEGWKRLYQWLFSSMREAVAAYIRERDLQLDEQASEHLAFLAHELRNPITSVRLALEVLEKNLAPRKYRATEVMQTNLERILELIDTQLVELRLRAGLRPQLEELAADDFLHDVAGGLSANARSKHQTIEVQSEPIHLEADPRLLRSVLLNLLGNAIKFSPEGATIRIRGRQDGERIVLSVLDQCGGLPEGQAEKMFSPFVQMGRNRTGHGLGLAIAKQATEAHEGSIRVHDYRGRGCEFIVDLPLRPSPTIASDAPPP